MADVEEETLRALVAELQRVREALTDQQRIIAALQESDSQRQAAIDEQQLTIAQQQVALDALHAQRELLHGADAAAPTEQGSQDGQGVERATRRHPSRTSRRRLLAGAGATAAAVTAAVTLSAGTEAHADNGGNFILGQSNTATLTTSLSNTSVPSTALSSTGGAGGVGVYGESDSNTGWGIEGFSDSGYGVVGQSSTGIDLGALGLGRIYQRPQTQSGPPSGNHFAGESIRDTNGDLWLCTSGNGSTNGTWVKVAHLAPSATSGGAITYLAKPIRLVDTRAGNDALYQGGGPWTAAQGAHQLIISNASYGGVTVPNNCLGAIGNLTVVASSQGFGGYVALVPHGATFSGQTSNINYGANQIIANFYNVGLASGAMDIYIGGYPTDVIIDLFAVIV